MLPDEKVRCHRTGFQETCFRCVTEFKCRLWKRVTLEGDPRTPPGAAVKPVDHYDCVDSLIDLYLQDQLRRQLQTTATVDKVTTAVDTLRREVKEANDVQMVGAIAHLNNRMDSLRDLPAAAPQKLLE